ncbi:conserved exported protein of unknown function [Tenacibaculum sp. 190524A02b]|uniref:hypothetical protein n=1 Tax=Tenacibaculum vairaonense TaxID=3137860 RepID=UPI0032B0FB59
MKKLTFKTLFYLLIIISTGCTNEDLITNEQITNSKSVSSQNSEEESFKNDVFVNGINQTYLKETGMTESELLTLLGKENSLEEFKTDLNEKSDKKEILGKPSPINKAHLAGAIAHLVIEIAKNPCRYFEAIAFRNGSGNFLKIGLSHQVIQLAVANLPNFDKEIKTGKKGGFKHIVNLSGYNFIKTETTNNTIKVKINTEIRYRLYRRVFGKYRKVIDRLGSLDLQIPFLFNTKNNKIEINSITTDNIKIQLPQAFLLAGGPVNKLLYEYLIYKFVSITVEDDFGKVSFDKFLPKQYVEFIGVSSGGSYSTNFNFKINNTNFYDFLYGYLDDEGC